VREKNNWRYTYNKMRNLYVITGVKKWSHKYKIDNIICNPLSPFNPKGLCE